LAQRALGVVIDVLRLHPVVAHAALSKGADPMIVKSVALQLRGPARDQRNPPECLVQRWRRESAEVARLRRPQNVAGEASDRWAEIALELPVGVAARVNAGQDAPPGSPEARRYPVDPLHLIRGLNFAKFLRDQRGFSEALQAATDFEKAVDPGEVVRDRKADPPRTTRQGALEQLDVTGMLLQRREFRANRLCGLIRGINLFTDASPVTGEELQGMVMETICKPMEVTLDVLPGSTLCYGQYGGINKSVALLFSLWLVAVFR